MCTACTASCSLCVGLLYHPCPGLRCTCRLLDVAGSRQGNLFLASWGRDGDPFSQARHSDSPSGSTDDARERVDGYQQRLSLGFVPFHLLLVELSPSTLDCWVLEHGSGQGATSNLWAERGQLRETHLRGQICLGILKV